MNKFPNKNIQKLMIILKIIQKNSLIALQKLILNYLKIAKEKLKKNYQSKNNIFVCGNGGSAAIANHFECDLKNLI